ncbi:aflatoxin biosynthesis ketoreductase nor-1 [Colletotrichum cuscutae]|uniref:Aflatoxin biosynthesis ketoreductase nor-1 n=1 Tax=Colletotrichum cuscutae TaxID=1209917 RepID=A0AAI9XSQ9_9PEZI|nr:aflatoxin biosynthesis ketoreductase nor-1 [Colletotrichum cuscutae]
MARQAFKDVEAAGIEHVDLIIASAGMGPMPPKKLDTAEIETVEYTLQVNTLGPIRLFQAFKPLLDKSTSPKWVSVSSGAGSITNCEKYMAFYAGAYGVSKAAQDWFTVHVQTEMGNIGARIMGLKEAPHTIEESTSKTIDLIDNATRESTSGKFINVITGQEIPW